MKYSYAEDGYENIAGRGLNIFLEKSKKISRQARNDNET
jgi:hypothetical protein